MRTPKRFDDVDDIEKAIKVLECELFGLKPYYGTSVQITSADGINAIEIALRALREYMYLDGQKEGI